MKYARTLSMVIALATVAALTAFPGIAAATQITSPAGTVSTSSLQGTSEGHLAFHGPSGIKLECNSKFVTSVEQHGAGLTVKGNVSELIYTNCTNNHVVNVLKKGTMEIHPITGTSNGTMTSSGVEMEMVFSTIFGKITCFYSSPASIDIGTLTGSSATGGTAVLDVAMTLPRTGGSSLCGASGVVTGKYKIVTPDSLLVDA